MQFGLGLLESLGLRRSLLLEVGLFRTQLGLELLQRLRPLGEFDRFVRGLFPKGAFARLDLEESLFGLLRSAFGARMHLGRGPPRFLGGLLAALEVLVASSDPVDVGPDLFFLFFDVDFARLDPHYPIGPRGTRRSGVLLERVSLALEQRLLGLQRRLPGPSLLGRLRLLAPQSSPLFLEFFGAIREIGLPGFEVAPDLVGLRCFDFEGLLPTGQFAKAPGVFVRLGAVGVWVLVVSSSARAFRSASFWFATFARSARRDSSGTMRASRAARSFDRRSIATSVSSTALTRLSMERLNSSSSLWSASNFSRAFERFS